MSMRNKLKRGFFAVFGFIILFLLGGCWNYRGLDKMSIVAGMALDFEDGRYLTTFEILDITKPAKEEGPSSVLLDSEGETIFEAVRNAKKKVKNKLFFGHMTVVIVSEELAKGKDISQDFDWFMRDAETRETLYFVISREKSAADILRAERMGSSTLSYDIEGMLDNDNRFTLSTHSHQLFQVYAMLHSPGESLTLPAAQVVNKEGKPRMEINGTAVFKGQSLSGYITPLESKYFLFALDEVKGGVLTAENPGNHGKKLLLEISKNRTDRSFSVNQGKITFVIEIKTDAFVGESDCRLDLSDEATINQIAESAQRELERGIEELVKKAQREYKSDIFGFGNLIRKRDPALWRQLEGNWDEEFTKINVEVSSEFKILNTALKK